MAATTSQGFARVTVTRHRGELPPLITSYEQCKGVGMDPTTGLYTIVSTLGHPMAQFMMTPDIVVEFEPSPVLLATPDNVMRFPS